jgi:hypothetical protein
MLYFLVFDERILTSEDLSLMTNILKRIANDRAKNLEIDYPAINREIEGKPFKFSTRNRRYFESDIPPNTIIEPLATLPYNYILDIKTGSIKIERHPKHEFPSLVTKLDKARYDENEIAIKLYNSLRDKDKNYKLDDFLNTYFERGENTGVN